MRITHPQVATARRQLHKICCDIAKDPVRGKSFVIYGANGCGKTRLLRQVCRWFDLIAMNLKLVIRADCDDQLGLAWSVLASWPEVVDGFQKYQNFLSTESMHQCSLLLLDDLGAEHDPSKYGEAQLYLLLNRREFRWNIFTTNFSPEYWERKFEKRIASRLFRNAEHIDMSEVPDFSTV